MAGKSILKVLSTLTHLSLHIQSVVSAADFYEAKDKAQFLHGGFPEIALIKNKARRSASILVLLDIPFPLKSENMYASFPFF